MHTHTHTTTRRLILAAIAVLIVAASTTTAHAKYDPFDVWGYVAYTPPARAPTTTTAPAAAPAPVAVCVGDTAHPCGHRTGASIAAACGDPTCGRKDDAKFCNGASPCWFCCCGCSSGCGTGDHDPAPPCTIDGGPCTK